MVPELLELADVRLRPDDRQPDLRRDLQQVPREGARGDLPVQLARSRAERLSPGMTGTVMAKYRRRRSSDRWHSCRNCWRWPTENYIECNDRPGGELCLECQRLELECQCESEEEAAWRRAVRGA